MDIKEILNKIYIFLWKDDSIWSWIVSLILAFIIVKFIFFPFLSLILGTAMPLVVIESGSMHHPGGFVGNTFSLQDNFNIWWNQKGDWYLKEGISKSEASSWSLRTGLEMGDIVIVSSASNLEIGDIIIFQAGQRHPLIHRIVNIKTLESGEKIYSTKGDNNSGQLTSEKEISEDKLIGKASIRIPKLGWLKLVFVKIFQGFR
tara:strand:- start:2711 stop:3319 length:609 start_codon:yes stop_codon:yes gene_type:complete